MRLILDTNILLSALLSPLGAPAKLIDAWERKIFTLVTSAVLIAEFREVAGRPFFRARLRASAVESLAADLQALSFYCERLPSATFAPDPKDRYLLAMAQVSRADFLVTGDKELLSLKQYRSTRIISPAVMMEILKDTESGERKNDK